MVSLRETIVLRRIWLGVAYEYAYSFLIKMASSAASKFDEWVAVVEHPLCQCPSFETSPSSFNAKLHRFDGRPFLDKKHPGTLDYVFLQDHNIPNMLLNVGWTL